MKRIVIYLLAFTLHACGGGGTTTPDEQFPGAPSAVTNVTVTAGDSQNVVSWGAVEGAVSYNLYWDVGGTSRTTAKAADCTGERFEGITDTSYTHTALSNGTSYSYNVTAVDGNGAEGECGGSSANSAPSQTVVPGCTDSSANNYNPNATEDDDSCEYANITGCTDSSANNYDPDAIVDDGSCTFDSGGGGSTPTCPFPTVPGQNGGCI